MNLKYLQEVLHADAVSTVEEYAIWGGIPRYYDMRDVIQASTLLSVIGSGANRLSEIAARLEKPATHLSIAVATAVAGALGFQSMSLLKSATLKK